MPCLATSCAERPTPTRRPKPKDIKVLLQLKRYLNAWSRHHRSGGFGIHSPYAYQFVRNVWRQRLPYYAYDDIHELHSLCRDIIKSRGMQVDQISEREAKLLFRVTNHFNPLHLLQTGTATGLESATLVSVNSNSHLYVADHAIENNELAAAVLQRLKNRVDCYDNPSIAVDEMLSGRGANEPALALLNIPTDEAARLLDAGVVVVMRNLHRDKAMQKLFDDCCCLMTAGQTYTNNKIAILNPNPKLQREDFLLWL